MAFIALRRPRNTNSDYLVERHRDGQGSSRKRTLCYLGREGDGTDTLEKAVAHWLRVREQCRKELRRARGGRNEVLRRRRDAAAARLHLLTVVMEEQARCAGIIADLDGMAGRPPVAEGDVKKGGVEAGRARHRRRRTEPAPPPKPLTVQEERAALRALLKLPPSEKG
jgi:hypothetical protein